MFILPAGRGLIKPKSSAPASPAIVQSATASITATPLSLSPTWGSATTANNLLIAVLSMRSVGPTPYPSLVVPPSGKGWTLAKSQVADLGNSGGRGGLFVYYSPNAASQSGASTWTWTGGSYMGTASAIMAIMEYSNATGASPLDKTASYTSPSNGGGSPYTNDTTVYSGTPATTSQADELVIAAMQTLYAQSSPSGSFTQRISVTTPHFLTVSDKILSATGTPNTSATYATASMNNGVLATFKFP